MEGQTERELEKMWQGTMRSEGKRPRTTSVIDPPLHDSFNFTSWINSFMVIWSGYFSDRNGFGCCWWWWPHLSDASLPFHNNCADRETSQQKHYVGATSSHAICPCSPLTYTVLTTLQRTRSTSRSRFFGRPPFTTGNKTNLASNVVYNTQWCNMTHRLLQTFFLYHSHT